MIPVYHLDRAEDAAKISALVARLRLDPAAMALGTGTRADKMRAVQTILHDVATRGDAALIDSAKQFDDPNFTASRLRVGPDEMAAAHGRISQDLRDALQRSIDQVHEYQSHVLPVDPHPLNRGGLALKLRFTPIDSVGVYFPGGKASYPSSLIMLAVPAMVAGVKRVVVCSPSGKFGGDIVLAAAHAVGVTEMYRMGGAAAVGALAFGTQTVKAVDKIVGPGNEFVQLAKRAVSGAVGIDGYLGPSEILTIADDSGDPRFIAADLIAQAEHDPGSCFLLTTSQTFSNRVAEQISVQLAGRNRSAAIERALLNESMIVIARTTDQLLDLANQIACEHVSLQTKENDQILAKLRHAGAVYVGPWSPVAAGDYIAGPSHCLPTNTTARFGSGISVYEFLKRTSIVTYDEPSIGRDAKAIVTLATAEQLDAHAASVAARVSGR
jgi:histidinol dehydrogenase